MWNMRSRLATLRAAALPARHRASQQKKAACAWHSRSGGSAARNGAP
jgi:hypothetical protein